MMIADNNDYKKGGLTPPVVTQDSLYKNGYCCQFGSSPRPSRDVQGKHKHS